MTTSASSSAFAAALMAALIVAATPSRAAEPDGAPDASKHFRHGVELSDDGDWRAALIEFERAYAITPNFRVLYDIGQCRFQLHDYPGALGAFRRYLTEGADQVPGDRRTTVEADIESLKGRVAFMHLVAAENGAEVSVDDTVVGATPFAAPVAVSAGRHKVTVSKSGFASAVQYVDIAGEETLDVTLTLGAGTVAPALASTVSPARHRSIAPALVAFGIGAVGLGMGSYFGVTAVENKHDLDGTCVQSSCPASSQSLYNEAQRNALWSTVGFGAAIAGAGVGAGYLLFTRPRESATPSVVAEVRLLVSRGSIGAAGTF